jgi:hypothetical protein
MPDERLDDLRTRVNGLVRYSNDLNRVVKSNILGSGLIVIGAAGNLADFSVSGNAKEALAVGAITCLSLGALAVAKTGIQLYRLNRESDKSQ